jgi:hypothetical protein
MLWFLLFSCHSITIRDMISWTPLIVKSFHCRLNAVNVQLRGLMPWLISVVYRCGDLRLLFHRRYHIEDITIDRSTVYEPIAYFGFSLLQVLTLSRTNFIDQPYHCILAWLAGYTNRYRVYGVWTFKIWPTTTSLYYHAILMMSISNSVSRFK